MLNKDQLKTIDKVTQRFLTIDSIASWTNLDDALAYLEYLQDNELLNEAYLLSERHRWGDPHCTVDHPKNHCIVPDIISAIDSLLNHYNNEATISTEHKIIMQYYLALDYTGEIIY